MRLPLLALALVACTPDNALTGKDDASAFDTGDAPDSDPFATEEVCNGLDDDRDGEVDEGFPDADGNGRVDCLDAECSALTVGAAGSVVIDGACDGIDPPVADPWNVAVKWQLPDDRSSATTPLVGQLDDDDGDGVITDADAPDVVLNVFDAETRSASIVALEGATGAEKWSWAGAAWGTGTAVADVDDDGEPEVVAFDAEGRPVALEGDGTVAWTAPIVLPTWSYPHVTVADLDGDGRAEVLAANWVLDGRTGMPEYDYFGMDNVYSIPTVADVDLDGDQEVLYAGRAWDSDGALLWESDQVGRYGAWAVVVQADADPEAEIGFLGAAWSLREHDGTLILERTHDGNPGPPCAGDFDGDGVSEVAWGAEDAFLLYELDGTLVWSAEMTDSSGLAGCSGFDVDGDGALEILFADETTFRILDGATGAARYTSTDHGSGTLFEYPTVADLDQDGHAEILYVANELFGERWPALTVIEHAGDGWAGAGSTWGIHDFAVTNLGALGEVPAAPEPAWTAHGMLRARPREDPAPSPDLRVAITDVCVADCDYGPVQVAVHVSNAGGAEVGAGAVLSLYAVDGDLPRLVATATLPAVPAGTALDGITLALAPADVGTSGFRATVDEVGAVAECSEANNQDDWRDGGCPER